jgi:uncharacterized SAM-binding protein YcdF (DUF218 family)
MDADFAFRAVLKALVLPPAGSVWLVCVGLWAFRTGRRWGWLAIGAGLSTLLVLSVPIVADGLAIRAASALPYPDWDGRPQQAIVVLSGGIRVNTNGTSGSDVRAVTLTRLAAAAALARRTGLPLLLSGGAVEKGPADAVVMASVLDRAFGLKAAFIEDRSRNTHENAVESARILRTAGIQRVWLITSDVHLPRAVAEFQRVGLSVQPLSAGGPSRLPEGLLAWLPQPWALEESHSVLYEWLGDLVMQLPSRD